MNQPAASLATQFYQRLPARRTALKWLHWGIIPFFIWFIFADPDALRRAGKWVFRFHSVMGLIFVTLALIWSAMYLRQGLASRPGPKLPGWGRTFHKVLHHSLIWGLFLVAFGGFLLGLTSSVLLWAGGILPIAPPMGWPRANDLVGIFHTYQFYALAALVGIHACFHIWRHIRLRDNALRIMAPKVLHRFL
ncbi:MAG: cytochrome B [Litoreibacter sp.]|nr:cytochrome B [Litoreibacter sp.]